MPPGSSADRAACSRPDAGPRLSGGRSGPPPGGTGGRTGRSSPATTRQRPGADRGSTPTPAGSLHGSRLATDDPSSPAAPDITPAAKKVIYQPEARARDPVRFPRWRVGLICSSMRNFLAGVIALQRHRQEPAVAGSTSTPRTTDRCAKNLTPPVRKASPIPSVQVCLHVDKREPASSQILAVSVNQVDHERPTGTGLLSERLLPGVD